MSTEHFYAPMCKTPKPMGVISGLGCYTGGQPKRMLCQCGKYHPLPCGCPLCTPKCRVVHQVRGSCLLKIGHSRGCRFQGDDPE